jgi:hypothetical protein
MSGRSNWTGRSLSGPSICEARFYTGEGEIGRCSSIATGSPEDDFALARRLVIVLLKTQICVGELVSD